MVLNKILIHPFSQPLKNGGYNPKNWMNVYEFIEIGTKNGYSFSQTGVMPEIQVAANFINIRDSLEAIKNALNEHDYIISIDSLLVHANHSIDKKKMMVIYTVSDPQYFGYDYNYNVYVDKKYFRPNQFDFWENSQYVNEAQPGGKWLWEHFIRYKNEVDSKSGKC